MDMLSCSNYHSKGGICVIRFRDNWMTRDEGEKFNRCKFNDKIN